MKHHFGQQAEHQTGLIARQLIFLRDQIATEGADDKSPLDLAQVSKAWEHSLRIMPEDLAGHLLKNMPERTKFWIEFNPDNLAQFEIMLCAYDKAASAESRQIHASFNNSSGRTLRVLRHFDLETGTIEGWGARIYDENQRGNGVITQTIENFINLGQHLGMKEMVIRCASEIGSYSWPRYGFVPTSEAWPELREKLKVRLDCCASNLPDDVARHVAKLIDSDDPKDIWKLADMTHDLGGTPLGKRLLLPKFEKFYPHYATHYPTRDDRELEWKAVLKFDDIEQMDRFKTYIQSRKIKEIPASIPGLT